MSSPAVPEILERVGNSETPKASRREESLQERTEKFVRRATRNIRVFVQGKPDAGFEISNARDLPEGCRGIVLTSVRDGKSRERFRFVAMYETASVTLYMDGTEESVGEFSLDDEDNFTDVLAAIEEQLRRVR